MKGRSKCSLVVFAREPALNQVKQRLAGDVGAGAALQIYRRLLERTLRLARSVQRHGVVAMNGNRVPVRLVVAVSADKTAAVGQRLATFCEHADALLVTQRGKDLGSRMRHAIQDAAQHATDRVVLIGSDCPELQRSDLAAAYDALNRADVCMVPTVDGGYCLVGTRGDAPDVFDGIDWGQSVVAQQTRQRCNNLMLSLVELDRRHDVDYLSDWAEWCARQRARYLAEYAWEDADGDVA